MTIRASKSAAGHRDGLASEDFLTVPEAYYLATTRGPSVISATGDGFAPGDQAPRRRRR